MYGEIRCAIDSEQLHKSRNHRLDIKSNNFSGELSKIIFSTLPNFYKLYILCLTTSKEQFRKAYIHASI
uniref:Uncharacterized protein n=1 Tax=Oryza sativa subsp. japonica TaxID=39947 RepID=Q67IT0_ORYSJ|nr:hypothetical protein [Oryza sativa Japonica Group]BAD38611.1 hypothetical protein [Oryza sativa Japonica Group]